MDVFGLINIFYRIIYIYVVVMCVWSIFTHKELQRQIGYAMILVPFLLRVLNLK